jgi:hypothetical protein
MFDDEAIYLTKIVLKLVEEVNRANEKEDWPVFDEKYGAPRTKHAEC